MTEFKQCTTSVDIVHVIVGLNVGGAEMMLFRLVTADERAVSGTVVVSLTSLGVVGTMLRERGVEVHTLGMRSMLHMPRALWCLVALIRRTRPKIVQTWMYHADLIGGLAARLAGVRRVIWGVRTTDIGFSQQERVTAIVRWVCARLSGIIPSAIICAAAASYRLHVAIGYNAATMQIIPNGFDLDRLHATTHSVAALRATLGFSPDQLVIGCVGRFDPVKDQERFVRAAGIIISRFPLARFLMVGRGCDADNKELQAWLDQAGVGAHFVLLGERNDVPLCLAAMDIFCMNSRSEGFPNVVGEAMAMGRACVVTDVGDAAYLLGGHGIVVPKENTQALAEGLQQLLRLSKTERAQIGDRAHSRIATEFTIERTSDRFNALYARLLEPMD